MSGKEHNSLEINRFFKINIYVLKIITFSKYKPSTYAFMYLINYTHIPMGNF